MTSDKRNLSLDSSKSRKKMSSNMQNEPLKKLTEILNVLGLNKLSDSITDKLENCITEKGV